MINQEGEPRTNQEDAERVLDIVLENLPSIENRDAQTRHHLAEWVGRDLCKYQERNSSFQDSSVMEALRIAAERGLPSSGLIFGWRRRALRGSSKKIMIL